MLACCSMRPTNNFIVGADERDTSSEALPPRAPATEAAKAETADLDEGTAEPGRPVRKEMSVDATHTATGWLFHVDDVFHRERLRSFLECALARPDVQRCKVLSVCYPWNGGMEKHCHADTFAIDLRARPFLPAKNTVVACA